MVALRSAWPDRVPDIATGRHFRASAGVGPRSLRSVDLLPHIQRPRIFQSARPRAADWNEVASAGDARPRASLSSRTAAPLGFRALPPALRTEDTGGLRADTSPTSHGNGTDRRSSQRCGPAGPDIPG